MPEAIANVLPEELIGITELAVGASIRYEFGGARCLRAANESVDWIVSATKQFAKEVLSEHTLTVAIADIAVQYISLQRHQLFPRSVAGDAKLLKSIAAPELAKELAGTPTKKLISFASPANPPSRGGVQPQSQDRVSSSPRDSRHRSRATRFAKRRGASPWIYRGEFTARSASALAAFGQPADFSEPQFPAQEASGFIEAAFFLAARQLVARIADRYGAPDAVYLECQWSAMDQADSAEVTRRIAKWTPQAQPPRMVSFHRRWHGGGERPTRWVATISARVEWRVLEKVAELWWDPRASSWLLRPVTGLANDLVSQLRSSVRTELASIPPTYFIGCEIYRDAENESSLLELRLKGVTAAREDRLELQRAEDLGAQLRQLISRVIISNVAVLEGNLAQLNVQSHPRTSQLGTALVALADEIEDIVDQPTPTTLAPFSRTDLSRRDHLALAELLATANDPRVSADVVAARLPQLLHRLRNYSPATLAEGFIFCHRWNELCHRANLAVVNSAGESGSITVSLRKSSVPVIFLLIVNRPKPTTRSIGASLSPVSLAPSAPSPTPMTSGDVLTNTVLSNIELLRNDFRLLEAASDLPQTNLIHSHLRTLSHNLRRFYPIVSISPGPLGRDDLAPTVAAALATILELADSAHVGRAALRRQIPSLLRSAKTYAPRDLLEGQIFCHRWNELCHRAVYVTANADGETGGLGFAAQDQPNRKPRFVLRLVGTRRRTRAIGPDLGPLTVTDQ